ncbi:nucleotide-diphospho-sugar transferase [Rhizoctonia solani]|nr:nucleotide-diphospho-sugar transferase [Rhizoctonia solani]
MEQPTASLESAYRFTQSQDWFSGHKVHWRYLFTLITSPAPRGLEIGSWEGRSAVFTLTELCKSEGSLHNLNTTGLRYRIIPQFSVPALMKLLNEATYESNPGYDWIYIDGSHEASDTLLDGELAWRLARKDSVIIFDDYRWDAQPLESPHHPKRGIDSFLLLHEGEYKIISGTKDGEYQMVIRKTIDLNIGFAFEDVSRKKLHETLAQDSPVNVTLAVDTVYAMPASVTILSAANATPGRITFYVLDCGLTPSDENRLRESIPKSRPEITLVFLKLPELGLTRELGPVWAKFDLIEALPVERALYLDADILVRKDLRPLWSTDLQANVVAAAPDVGHPYGHPSAEGISRVLYFNSGVMLIDLARVRSIKDEIIQTARKMKDSYFKDQDALNIIFRGKWLELSLKWNASGLGTYANIPHPDRSKLKFAEMADPSIVHFTGPLHPPMAHVINPWVQPYVAKPWGYAGAPGHPYASEWWKVLESTGWRDWKRSVEYGDLRRRELDKAKAKGIEEFESAIRSVSVD